MFFSGANFGPTLQHGEWQTDFREYALATQLSAAQFWSRQDHIGTTDNAIAADAGALGGRSVAMTVTGVAGDTFGYTKPPTPSALTDMQVLVRYLITDAPDATGGAGPVMRLTNTGQDGYNATLFDDGAHKGENAEFAGRSRTGNVGGAAAIAWDTTHRFWTRVEMVGTTLRSKTWQDGSAEPGAWTISGTDATIAAGYAGLMSRPAVGVTIDWFSLATGGKTAAGPSG